MYRAVTSVSTLFSGIGLFLAGSGLLGLLISLRGAEAGLSDITIGLVMSGFYVGYVLGAWWCPALIERVGHIRTFSACAAGSAVAALLYGLVDHPVPWWVLRIVNGVLLMGLFMTIESWLIERTGKSDDDLKVRSRLFAVYVIVNLIALSVGQYLLLIYGVSSINSYIIVAILFSLAVIPVALTPIAQPAPIRTERVPTLRLFRVAPVGAMAALYSGLIVGSFWSMAPVFARGIGLNNDLIATLVVTTVAGGICLNWPIGWLSDRFDRRHIVAWVAVGAALAMIGVLLLPGSITALFVCSFLFGGLIFTIYSLAVTQTHDRFFAHESLQATRGILLLHGIGAVIGPLLTGLMMDWLPGGYTLSMILLNLTLSAFAAARIRIDPPVPVDERTPYAPIEQTSPLVAELDPRTPEESLIPTVEPVTPDVTDLPSPAQP